MAFSNVVFDNRVETDGALDEKGSDSMGCIWLTPAGSKTLYVLSKDCHDPSAQAPKPPFPFQKNPKTAFLLLLDFRQRWKRLF